VRYLQSTPPFTALPDARERHDKTPPAPLLAAAVHAQSEGVLIAARRWTRNGLRIIFANESFCAMTGYTGAELRERGQGFLHENRKDLTQLHRWQARLKPGSTLSGEGFLTRKDGARVYSSWSYCPVADEKDRVTHIVATYRDLTDKRHMQEALIHSQRLDAVGRLAGGVAHDFNNLLSVINGYCEMMVSKRSVRRLASRELGEIHQATQKAAHLVRQLLAFSRRQAVNPRIINLDHLIRENSSILARLLKPARSLEFSLAAGQANIHVDPAQIQQVLLNLILNARDALDETGTATISTSVQRTHLDDKETNGLNSYVVLSVSDNGSGMNEDVRSHLFEPFFTTKDTGKGTGLGLALVYGVVQQSGGFIRVFSEPNRGSNFEIFLPLVDKPAQRRSRSLPSLPTTQGREHVLLIEEDDVLRTMVADIFRADGYTVDAVSAASDALGLLRKQHEPIDLIIVQTGAKPSRDEETLAHGLHLMLPNVRVLTIGSADSGLFQDLHPSCQSCLAKPFTLSALLKAARGLLDVKTEAHP
jgi:PAS domain S-box-containing protein